MESHGIIMSDQIGLITCDLPVRPSFMSSDGHEGQEVVSNL